MKKVLEVDKEKPRMLEIGPFQRWIEEQIKEDNYQSTTNLSTVVGINTKRLESYRQGKTYGPKGKIVTHVSIDYVDKAAVLTGYHISEIYTDYYDWPNS